MYGEYKDIARESTEAYRLINVIFMAVELLAVLGIAILFYSVFRSIQIIILAAISILSILLVHGMISIFLKIYENTLISTFLQNDIRELAIENNKLKKESK